MTDQARRQKRSQYVHESYNFWSADEVHSYEQLRNFHKQPGTAVAMFRLMAGVPKNQLRRPEKLSLKVDTQGIIDRFANEIGHDANIKVCAVAVDGGAHKPRHISKT